MDHTWKRKYEVMSLIAELDPATPEAVTKKVSWTDSDHRVYTRYIKDLADRKLVKRKGRRPTVYSLTPAGKLELERMQKVDSVREFRYVTEMAKEFYMD